MATKKLTITEWKVVGDSSNFTVLGLSTDGKVYFWKDKQWNEL